MFSPSFALPFLPARGPGTVVLCHAVCSPGYFNSKTDEISIEKSVSAYWWGQLVCASHRSLSVCSHGSHLQKKNPHPSEFPDPVGMGLFNNGTSQRHGGPPRGRETNGDIHEAGQLESVFPGAGGRLCWVTFAGSWRLPHRLETSHLKGPKCQVVHLQRMYGLKKIPPPKSFPFFFFFLH